VLHQPLTLAGGPSESIKGFCKDKTMAETYEIGDGQTIRDVTLNDGDTMLLSSKTADELAWHSSLYQPGSAFGGAAYNVVINNGGSQSVSQSFATDTTVNAGGVQNVGFGGYVTHTTLNGGSQFSSNSAHIDGTVINAGGHQWVYQGVVSDVTINDGGTQYVYLASPSWGDPYNSIPSSLTGTTINSGGKQILYYGGDHPTGTHLMPGGMIELQYTFATPTNLPAAVLDPQTDILTVDGRSIYLAGDYSNTEFVVSATTHDGIQSTLITARQTCFCRGTMIDTPLGEVPIETLMVGEAVLTAGGGTPTIRWIGRQTFRPSKETHPVIVRQGALAESVPRRDLRLTRGHSLLLEGMLVPVGELVNGQSILWDEESERVEVYHIELDRHDIVLADGALAETYRDDGNRPYFDNARDVVRVEAPPPYAPVVSQGPAVDHIWNALRKRAGLIGSALSHDPDLHLMVDGQRFDPCNSEAGRYDFHLESSAAEVRLISRRVVPAAVGTTRDHRLLGVGLRALRAHSQEGKVELGYASPLFNRGFHAPEHSEAICWTDGDAVLPAMLLQGGGPIRIEVEIGCLASYPSPT
jgi:autotransporter passenger strand-loop-strand repeat protein